MTAVSASAATEAELQNWPSWRGPLASGVAPRATPPVTWDETRNVRWKVAVPGNGNASPIVWGDQIFVLAAIPTGKKVEKGADPFTNQPAAPRPITITSRVGPAPSQSFRSTHP